MKSLLVVLGATAVGKTALSLKLAEHYGTPILNADSRQVYRDIPIGTAAPTADEQRRVRHYFVGTLGLEQYYSAAQYEADALALLAELFKERDTVVMSGGSMLYLDAVCRGIDDIPTVDDATRTLLRGRLKTEGLPPLVEELRRLDPDYAAQCDLRNPVRVVHALEICHMTGRTYTSFRTGRKKLRPFRILKIGLRREREELFARIAQRVDTMMSLGLLDEVRRVAPFRACNALNTVGYKELFAYLDGTYSLAEAVEKIKRNTRVYAKKQQTWFQRDEAIHWFHPDDANAVFDFADEQTHFTD